MDAHKARTKERWNRNLRWRLNQSLQKEEEMRSKIGPGKRLKLAARKTQKAPSSSTESKMDSSDSSDCESLFPLSDEDLRKEAKEIKKKAKARRVIKKPAPAAAAKVTGSSITFHSVEEFLAARAKERETEPEEIRSDSVAYEARMYRKFWNDCFAGSYGSYETITSIPPMRFTDSFHGRYAYPMETLQIFSVRVAGIKEGLHWPLDVYGMVTARDTLDHNRNIIFDRKRDNCQTIREEDPYLALTGPSRAVLMSVHPTHIEADLKLKGHTESEDKDFSLLATAYISNCHSGSSFMTSDSVTSRLSTLEFTVGYMRHSVEATISVEVIGGEWPYGFRGVFTASTSSIDMEILLLAFGDDEFPVEVDGKIKLSRRVVCVEIGQPEKKLKVSAQALHGSEAKDVLRDDQVFTPQGAGRSQEMLKVGSCEMQVTVAWSLLSTAKF